MNSSAPARVGPVTQLERIQVIDILRGFALFGILLVSIELYGNPLEQFLLGHGELKSPADRLAVWGIRLLAEAKFYPILSFLFGLGFALQVQSAELQGTRFVPLYLRRLIILFLFGFAHAISLWVGDILVLYAVLGAILLLFFRRSSPRTLLVWTGVMLGLSFLFLGYFVGMALVAELMEGGRNFLGRYFADTDRALGQSAYQASQVYATGSFVEITAQRLSDRGLAYGLSIFSIFNVFAMFLLGLYAGRRGIFQDISGHLPLFRKILRWGFLLGISSNLFYVIAMEGASRYEPTLWSYAATIGQIIGAPTLALSYVAAITLLVQHTAGRKLLSPLAAVGRMPLSNYLLQSLIATTIFYGYGFGLFGQIGPALGILFTLAIFTAQIPLSVWWMDRFQFGPVEWLWRTLTYLRWQPFRLARASEG